MLEIHHKRGLVETELRGLALRVKHLEAVLEKVIQILVNERPASPGAEAALQRGEDRAGGPTQEELFT